MLQAYSQICHISFPRASPTWGAKVTWSNPCFARSWFRGAPTFMKCQCGSHSLPAAHLDAFGIGVAWPKKNHEGFKAQHPRPRVPRSMAACFTRLVYEAEAFPTSPCRWETPAWLQLDLSRVQKCLIKAKWNKGLWILGEGLPGGFCCQPSRLTREISISAAWRTRELCNHLWNAAGHSAALLGKTHTPCCASKRLSSSLQCVRTASTVE